MELRITECCKEKGLTLQDLADRLGVARSTLANTLTKKNPTLDTLEKISKALDVRVSDLIVEEKDYNTIICPECGAKIEFKKKEE